MAAYIGIAGEPNSTKLRAAGQAMHGIAGNPSGVPLGATRQALVGVAANTGQLVDAAGCAYTRYIVVTTNSKLVSRLS